VSFLLDTCALSELSRPSPEPRVIEWFDAQEPDSLFLSVLSVGEISRGIAALSPGRRKTTLTTWLASLRSSYADRVLGIDAAIAVAWGQITLRCERRGRPLAVVDGLIAATALHHGYAVVTRNLRDFTDTGATIVNPWGA
jgi:toxin FitB